MVVLPVAAMAAGITLVATVAPTPEANATYAMGEADYLIQANGEGATTTRLRRLLPAGTRIEATSYDDPTLVLPGRELGVNGRSLDLNGLARGMLVITEGRQPEEPSEVAISASVARLAEVAVGGQIHIEETGPATVVGLVEDTFALSARLVLQYPGLAEASADAELPSSSVGWLVSLPDGFEDIPGSEFDGLGCSADGDCAFWPVSWATASQPSAEVVTPILVLGGLALVESLLIASAAFAVGIRRRQRELGLLAAAGAEPRHIAATVLAEGGLLGSLGAGLGVMIGVAAILATSPWLDELTNRRNPPVVVDAASLLLAGGLGVLACLLAAALPAYSASRLPPLLALSGRRPPLRPARRLLIVGVALIAGGLFLTSTGAAMRLSDPGGSMSAVLMLVGAVAGVLGFGACSPWIIERLERLGLRLPPATRIALRDTARARSRNSPIVTAILAAFAATVAIATYFTSSDAANAASWQPWARPDQIVLQGDGAALAGPDVARELAAMAAAPVPWLATADGREVNVSIEDPTAPVDEELMTYRVTVGDEELLRALGAHAAAADLEGGAIVLLGMRPGDPVRGVAVVEDVATGRRLAATELPLATVATGVDTQHITGAVIAVATAERLGIAAGEVSTYVVRLPAAVTEDGLSRAAAIAAAYENTFAEAAIRPTAGNVMFRLGLSIASLLFALTVTGFAVALGEAEWRRDQRTLLAVGADPGIRRRIAAMRAGVVALLAGALAVPAGLLPAWGLLGSRDAPLVVPIPEVLAAVVILPVAGVVGALLLSPRIPPWSALREAST